MQKALNEPFFYFLILMAFDKSFHHVFRNIFSTFLSSCMRTMGLDHHMLAFFFLVILGYCGNLRILQVVFNGRQEIDASSILPLLCRYSQMLAEAMGVQESQYQQPHGLFWLSKQWSD